jgi:hypothetical protein
MANGVVEVTSLVLMITARVNVALHMYIIIHLWSKFVGCILLHDVSTAG